MLRDGVRLLAPFTSSSMALFEPNYFHQVIKPVAPATKCLTRRCRSAPSTLVAKSDNYRGSAGFYQPVFETDCGITSACRSIIHK